MFRYRNAPGVNRASDIVHSCKQSAGGVAVLEALVSDAFSADSIICHLVNVSA